MDIDKIYKAYPTKDDCLKHIISIRWNGKPICPYCRSNNATQMENGKRYHCNTCNTSFSITVGTLFHKTKLDLQKWFLAIALVLKAEKNISARQLASDLRVNKNTGWYLLKRIRKAMLQDLEMLKRVAEYNEL